MLCLLLSLWFNLVTLWDNKSSINVVNLHLLWFFISLFQLVIWWYDQSSIEVYIIIVLLQLFFIEFVFRSTWNVNNLCCIIKVSKIGYLWVLEELLLLSSRIDNKCSTIIIIVHFTLKWIIQLLSICHHGVNSIIINIIVISIIIYYLSWAHHVNIYVLCLHTII